MVNYNGAAMPNHHDLITLYHDTLVSNLNARIYRPLILPYDLFGFAFLTVYLCIPHGNRPWLYAARWPVAGIIVAFYIDTMRSIRSNFMGSGFGVGLIVSWLMVWSLTWLLFNEPQRDAKRIERIAGKENSVLSQLVRGGDVNDCAENAVEKEGHEAVDGAHTDRGSQSGAPVLTSGGSAMGNISNGVVTNRDGNGHSAPGNGHTIGDKEQSRPSEFFWQSYPTDSPWARINWVVDLLYNFRGPGWNWELRQNPGPPPEMLAALGEPPRSASSDHVSYAGFRRYSTRFEMARHILPKMLLNYLLLDFLKVVLMKDAYFLLGPSGKSYPHPYSVPDAFVPLIRQFLSVISIITALQTIFLLAPICFCLLLGPFVFGLRGEVFMYPSTWGSISIIASDGLNGLWSGWWHQTFRFAFISPTQYLIRQGILVPRVMSTKIIGVIIAFSISGLLHASGSYTQTAPSKPWCCFIFFQLQAVGIFLQGGICHLLRKQIAKLPLVVRQMGNLTYAATWLYVTGPWLIDDFARGGIWLFEPVPFSPLRALGFGVDGDMFSCWDFSGVHWFDGGGRWWMKGLAF